MPESLDEFMTVAEVAEVLKLNPQTVRNCATGASCRLFALVGACGSSGRTLTGWWERPKPELLHDVCLVVYRAFRMAKSSLVFCADGMLGGGRQSSRAYLFPAELVVNDPTA